MFDKTESYEEWLFSVTQNTNPETVSENWVVTDTFFAVRKIDRKIVGIIDLRHTLNDFLKNLGNCGYSVRPSERKKGYERENLASVKVIRKNNGVYERSFIFENKPADIYRITL